MNRLPLPDRRVLAEGEAVADEEATGRGTTAAEVATILGWLEEHHVVYQVNGGWAVDALVGKQTRPHRDVDIFLDEAELEAACRWLADRGYVTETNWLPARIEMRAGTQRVDLHPMALDVEGNGVQRGRDGEPAFCHRAVERTIGTIQGRPATVATAARLRQLHTGYTPRAVDLHDLALLARMSR